MGLYAQPANALESRAGIQVCNSGRVTGRRIDGKKAVSSGRSGHVQSLLQTQLSMSELITMFTKRKEWGEAGGGTGESKVAMSD